MMKRFGTAVVLALSWAFAATGVAHAANAATLSVTGCDRQTTYSSASLTLTAPVVLTIENDSTCTQYPMVVDYAGTGSMYPCANGDKDQSSYALAPGHSNTCTFDKAGSSYGWIDQVCKNNGGTNCQGTIEVVDPPSPSPTEAPATVEPTHALPTVEPSSAAPVATEAPVVPTESPSAAPVQAAAPVVPTDTPSPTDSPSADPTLAPAASTDSTPSSGGAVGGILGGFAGIGLAGGVVVYFMRRRTTT